MQNQPIIINGVTHYFQTQEVDDDMEITRAQIKIIKVFEIYG